MYGYPKVINTRKDVELLVGYLGTSWATPELVARGLAYLKGLRDKTKHYVFDRVLADGEDPDGGEPDYRVLEEEADDGSTVRRQYTLEDNPRAPIHRLGFTVDEVQALIDQIEGAQ